MSRRLASWKSRLLNTAGRICLAKSVLAAIPTYTMQVVWLPRRTTTCLNRITRSFIWSRNSGGKGWHLLNWETLVLPKHAGGVGMRDAAHANTSLMGKLVWSLLQNSEKLWVRVLAHKYLGNGSVLEATTSPSSSSLWKGVLKARDVLKTGFEFKLGNGRTSFWFEDWSGHGALGRCIPFIHISDSALTLADVLVNGSWNISRLATIVPEYVQQRLVEIQPRTRANIDDHWVWKHSSKGVYTASDAYAWMCHSGPQLPSADSWSWLWKTRAPEKVRVFLLLLLHGVIQVNSHRFRCHLANSPACPRCSHHLEDGLHCLRDCPYSREVWSRLNALNWSRFAADNVKDWVRYQVQGPHATLFVAAIWGLWRWRNISVLGDNDWTVDVVVRWILQERKEYEMWLGNGTGLEAGTEVVRWKLPPSGYCKLNTDGAYSHSKQRMGCGGLVRDTGGAWVKGFMAGSGGGDPLMAEILALKMGLTLLWDNGIRSALCEVDCKEIVDTLHGDHYHFHQLATEFGEIKTLMNQEWTIQITHIPRSANDAADCLAELGAVRQCNILWLEDPPPELNPILARDLLAL